MIAVHLADMGANLEEQSHGPTRCTVGETPSGLLSMHSTLIVAVGTNDSHRHARRAMSCFTAAKRTPPHCSRVDQAVHRHLASHATPTVPNGDPNHEA